MSPRSRTPTKAAGYDITCEAGLGSSVDGSVYSQNSNAPTLMPTAADVSLERRGKFFSLACEHGAADFRLGEAEDFEGSDDFIPTTGVILERDLVAFLGHIEVDDDARNRGWGTALMERAFAEAKHFGADAIYLHSASPHGTTSDPTPFYEKLGFAAVASDQYGRPFMRRALESHDACGWPYPR